MAKDNVLVLIDNYLENMSIGEFFNITQDEKGIFSIANKDSFNCEIDKLYQQLKGIEYTDDDRKIFKKIRASFNKISKRLVDDLKAQKEFYFSDLDKEIKEIKLTLEDFSSELKKRLDESEKRFRDEKEKVVKNHFNELIAYKPKEISDILKLEDIFESSWLNRTITEKQIINDLTFRIDTIENLIKDDITKERYIDAIKVMDEFDFNSSKIFEIIKRFEEVEKEKIAKELAKKDKEELQKLLENENKLNEETIIEQEIIKQPKRYVTIKLDYESFDKIKQIFKNLEIDFEVID